MAGREPDPGGRAALRTTVAYACGAALWIVLSDRILGFLQPADLEASQTVKGLAFVAITSGLLYLALRTLWTARFALEAERRRLQDSLEQVLETVPGFVFRRGAAGEGPIHSTSASAATVTGNAREELGGLSGFLSLVDPSDRARLAEELAEAHRTQAPYTSTYRIRTAAGEQRWLWEHGCPKDGEIEGLCLDTTARRALEARLIEAEKLEAVGRLAAGVAHDFNNLLTVVVAYGDVLDLVVARSETVANEARPALDAIRQAADRAGKLTKQLMLLGREQPRAPRPVGLSEVVRELAGLLEKLIGRELRLGLELCEQRTTVLADRSELERILLNLANNARDASASGGRITVRTRVEAGARGGPRVVLEVADEGEGMDEATRARAFEAFFTTKTPERGTGLGLPTVYSLVAANGGQIEVASEEGRGTCFTLRFPACADAPEPEPSLPRMRRRQVLVVERDPESRAVIQAVLSAQGLEALWVSSSSAALELWSGQKSEIGLLIAELYPEGASGRALARLLREEDPELPVTFLSAHLEDREPVPGELVLSKPFAPRELSEAIRRLIETEAREDPS